MDTQTRLSDVKIGQILASIPASEWVSDTGKPLQGRQIEFTRH